ncbi:hypothetical protein TNCV_1366121 [Trichonephila clavipes]|nr:hypothetical protein TNCV_1366121 [Trichonephila clavipes]
MKISVTVNGDRYRAMITNFFIPELNNHDVQELWFQQDDATCHTARATIDLLKDTFGFLEGLTNLRPGKQYSAHFDRDKESVYVVQTSEDLSPDQPSTSRSFQQPRRSMDLKSLRDRLSHTYARVLMSAQPRMTHLFGQGDRASLGVMVTNSWSECRRFESWCHWRPAV